MTLKELRQQWETSGTVLLTLTSPAQEVYTIVSFDVVRGRDSLDVFHYFKHENGWEMNIVVNDVAHIEQCFDYMNREFARFYPKS
jgi:hypothetical protein